MPLKKRAHKVSAGTARGAKRRPLDEGAKVLLNKGMMDEDNLKKRIRRHSELSLHKKDIE